MTQTGKLSESHIDTQCETPEFPGACVRVQILTDHLEAGNRLDELLNARTTAST